ncbi:MAG: hypothetical protein D6718_09400 [Acidobacteria bacterium]|nr:MAG: hypothetical protein D6718_09400 [Acidobacteriota bacterium]
MRAALIAVGTELTRGELPDANASWLASRMTDIGAEVIGIAIVGDDPRRIGDALERAAGEADVVVVTGGLGPTSDDLTAAAVAQRLGVPLERREEAVQAIRSRFAALGRRMPQCNLKQADIPRGAALIPNPAGTAPGFSVRLAGARCFFLPGVPGEMRAMFEASVAPEIARSVANPGHQIVLRCFGVTESRLAESIAALEPVPPGIELGYRVRFPEIELKVLARGGAAAAARARAVADRIRSHLGPIVYSEGRIRLPELVVSRLARRGAALALLQDVASGAALPALVASAAEGDRVLRRADVRPEVAADRRTALELRRRAGTDAALVLGLAAPGAGSTVASWAAAGPGGLAREGRRSVPGPRDRVSPAAAWLALRAMLDLVGEGEAPDRN